MKKIEYTASEIVNGSTIFERLNNDVNGNPRYYIAWFVFGDIPAKVRSSLGLKLYRGKKNGAGYVISSYNVENDIERIINHLNDI